MLTVYLTLHVVCYKPLHFFWNCFATLSFKTLSTWTKGSIWFQPCLGKDKGPRSVLKPLPLLVQKHNNGNSYASITPYTVVQHYASLLVMCSASPHRRRADSHLLQVIPWLGISIQSHIKISKLSL